MKTSMEAKFRPVDVPQSDSFPTIRTVVESVESAKGVVAVIAERIGVSERHVRYRLQSARILGLVDGNRKLTRLGRELLATPIGSRAEKAMFLVAVSECLVVSKLFPRILTLKSVDVDSMAARISRVTGMSYETAHRRARVLRSWQRQLKAGEEVQK